MSQVSLNKKKPNTQGDTKVNTEDTLSGFQDFSKFSFNLSSRSGPKIKHLEKYEFRTSTTPSCSGNRRPQTNRTFYT